MVGNETEKSYGSPRENNPDSSALVTTLLELLIKKEPELCSPALRSLQARRECPRHP